MTQLIAAACDNRNGLILVSDRMIGTADYSLYFEHEPKIDMINPVVAVLTAGTMHEPEIIEDAKLEIAGQQSVRQITDLISKHYREVRRTRIENGILEKYGIRTFDEFHNKQQILHDEVIKEIQEKLSSFEMDLDILISGVDQRPHIYLISDPGLPQSYDEVGYCCTGSGENHADPVFAFYSYSPSLSAEYIIQIAYIAKRKAEMAGGVGKKTDLWILNNEGCSKVSETTVANLDNIYERQVLLSSLSEDLKIEFEQNTRN
jgi:hypothetical protein